MAARFRLNGFFASGPTYKVGLMLSLCGEPFDFKSINLGQGEHKQPAYLAKARFGQVPCLEDLSNGRNLVQSAAILEYLADKLGKFGGSTLNERLDAREWLFWDFDRLAPYFFRYRMTQIGFIKLPEDVVADLKRVADLALGVLEGHLSGRNWLVGDNPTIADIDVYGVLSLHDEAKIDLKGLYPNIGAFMSRIEALPGYQPRMQLLPMEDRSV